MKFIFNNNNNNNNNIINELLQNEEIKKASRLANCKI